MKIVLCNCPVQEAPNIAKTLVEDKIAACVNVIPQVQSFYVWEGKLCEDTESTLLIKIRQHDFVHLRERLQKIHPYDVPEIVEISVSDVNDGYRQWVYQMTAR